MTGTTTAVVCDDHFLDEISLHGVSSDNTGGMGEIAKGDEQEVLCGLYRPERHNDFEIQVDMRGYPATHFGSKRARVYRVLLPERSHVQ